MTKTWDDIRAFRYMRHALTSSAMASGVGGTSRPRAFAVLRFTPRLARFVIRLGGTPHPNKNCWSSAAIIRLAKCRSTRCLGRHPVLVSPAEFAIYVPAKR